MQSKRFKKRLAKLSQKNISIQRVQKHYHGANMDRETYLTNKRIISEQLSWWQAQMDELVEKHLQQGIAFPIGTIVKQIPPEWTTSADTWPFPTTRKERLLMVHSCAINSGGDVVTAYVLLDKNLNPTKKRAIICQGDRNAISNEHYGK